MIKPPYHGARLIWNEDVAATDVVIDNIEDYYTFTPVNLYFNQVAEGADEHFYYSVHPRSTILDLPDYNCVAALLGIEVRSFQSMLRLPVTEDSNIFYQDSKGNRWHPGDPLPNCGHTYRGKPTIHNSGDMFHSGWNTSLVGLNRKFTYQVSGQKCYALCNENAICLSCLGIQDLDVIDNFLQESLFETITTAMPKRNQPTLKSAQGAFRQLSGRCKSLDLRGLKFDRNTDIENMLEYLCIDTGNGSGLKELILTPAQYRLFTSTNCQHNRDALELLERKFEADKKNTFQSYNLADEDEMIRMGRELIMLEKRYKMERKMAKNRQFGAYFFGTTDDIDDGDALWDYLKNIISIQPVDAATTHTCSCTLLEDDGGFYSYTPVDEKFQTVTESSPDHAYYSVEFRDYIQHAVRNHRFLSEEKAPDTGRFYRGKPVASLSETFFRYDVDTSLIRKYKVLHYVMTDQDREKYYFVGLGDEVDLSSVDLSETTCLQGFIQDNQFKKIKILQPPERYQNQPVLTNARYAFSFGSTCQSLDIRGMKFDSDTDVTGMFQHIAIAPIDLHRFEQDIGLKELIVTPEQYALFTSSICPMKDRERERLTFNANLHRNHILDGSGVWDDETVDEAMARVNGYLTQDFEQLEAREYGSFFFHGLYDYNESDMMKWEALKTIIVVRPLS